MRVLLAAVGTRGDVQPALALALKVLQSGASPYVSGWSLSAFVAGLNLLMFYRIGQHLRRFAGETA